MATGDRGGAAAKPRRRRTPALIPENSPRANPPPVRAPAAAETPRRPLPAQTRGAQRAAQTRYRPGARGEILDVLQRHAGGELSYAEARKRLLELNYEPVARTFDLDPSTRGRSYLAPGGSVEQAVGNFELGSVQRALGLVPGLVSAATHPVRTGKAIGHDYAYRYGPGLHGDFGELAHRVGEDPISYGADVVALAGVGLGTASRVSAASRAAQTGRLAGRAIEEESINPAFRLLPGKAKLAAHGFAHPATRGLLEAYAKRRGIDRTDELDQIANEITDAFSTAQTKSSFRVRKSAAAESFRSSASRAAWNEAIDGVRVGAIYLRPAYLPNNWAGNSFLNFVHQGFLAPVNLGKSFVITKKLGERRGRVIDTAMGQGATAAVSGEGATFVRAVTDPLVSLLGKAADTPFRRSAFLHEARRAGYRTLGQVSRLIDEATSDVAAGGRTYRNAKMRELSEIARKANEEIVRFGKLSPKEQFVGKNVFFVYPWVKGASRYAGRFPLQHPVQTGVLNEFAKEGARRQEEQTGGLPPWLAGNMVVGHNEKGDPYLLNPLGVSPFGTALGVANAAQGTAKVVSGGHVGGSFNEFTDSDVESMFNPLLSAYLRAREGRSSFPEGLAESNALVRLGEGLTGRGGSRIFPGSPREAAGSYLVGLYPRKADKVALAQAAAEYRRQTVAARFSPAERAYNHDLAEARFRARKFRFNGGRVPDEVVADLSWKRDLDAALHDATSKTKDGKLPARERAMIAAQAFVARYPQAQAGVAQALAGARTPKELEDLYEELRGEAQVALREWNEDVNAKLEELAVAKAR